MKSEKEDYFERTDRRTLKIMTGEVVKTIRIPSHFTQRQIEHIVQIELRDHVNELRERSIALAMELEKSFITKTENLTRPPKEMPPALAEAAFSLLLPKRTVDAQIGDMQEMFVKNVTRFGVGRARRLYWYEVLRAIWPALLRVAKKVGFFGLVVDYIRAKFGF